MKNRVSNTSKEEDQENEEESKEATEPRTSMKKGKGQYSELLSLGAKIFMNVRIPELKELQTWH